MVKTSEGWSNRFWKALRSEMNPRGSEPTTARTCQRIVFILHKSVPTTYSNSQDTNDTHTQIPQSFTVNSCSCTTSGCLWKTSSLLLLLLIGYDPLDGGPVQFAQDAAGALRESVQIQITQKIRICELVIELLKALEKSKIR